MLNFKSHLKFLSRNKLYTFINVFGLSLSLVFVILIANFTVGELTTDKFHENEDRIYRIENESWASMPYPIGELLKKRYPEIEKTCGIQRVGSVDEIEVQNKKFKTPSIIAVDTTFFDMFSFKLIHGYKNQVLASRNSVVVSERFAKSLFGDSNPVGQSLKFVLKDGRNLFYNVSGVVEDFENSALNYNDIIISIGSMSDIRTPSNEAFYMSSHYTTVMYLQSVEGADITSKTDDILEYFKTVLDSYKGDLGLKQVVFTPISDVYFSNIIPAEGGLFLKGDKFIVNVLLIVGVLILVFAIFNYINLTVAQTGFRAKEVSMRRLLGTSKQSIFFKMIFESTLLCVIAFLIGLFLAITIEPYASDLIRAEISIVDDFSVMWGAFYVGLIIIIGVASGLMPAIVISRFKPIDVVKGAFTFKSKMIYSKIFITLQSVVTIVFIACSITVVKQIQHWTDVDLGYNQKGILNVQIGGYDKKDIEVFRNELKSLSIVKNTGVMAGTPHGGFFTSRQSYNIDGVDSDVRIDMIECDSVVAKILGFEFIKDNQVAGNGVWISESAAKMIDVKENTKFVKNNRHGELLVKGVIKDFKTGNLAKSDGLRPFFLNIKDTKDFHNRNIFIEVEGDLVNSYKEIEKVFDKVIKERYASASFNAKFFEQEIEDGYKAYNRLLLIIIVFTLIAIIISALGLLAMSTYFIQQRSLEIAIRKVFGSTTPQVLKKLIWQFLHLIVVAFVIACPIIWYMMSEWLKEFPLRIDLSMWIFVAAGIFTLLISFVTVYWQSSIAANANPVESIKK